MAFNWFKKLKNTSEQDESQNEQERQQTNQQIDQSSSQPEPSTSQAVSSVEQDEQTTDERVESDREILTTLDTESATPLQHQQLLPTHTNADKEQSSGYFQRLKQGLSKTRSGFADLFLGKKALDADLIDELEMQLLTADVGIEVTEKIIARVTELINRHELEDMNAVQTAMMSHMHELLAPYAQEIQMTHKPFVILMTGINGAGKTTTIGKLAHLYKSQGKKVMLAAGDTFRAAAVEQLQTWGERNNVPVIAQATGSDSASVAYDALQSAIAREVDVLIIDTAGRLHTQNHLMEELKKIKRVLKKLDETAPHETMLVIDAGNGQNALRQAQEFNQAMAVDGITITKLDGTAKGGILFAITNTLHLPIRFIGVGEKQSDLRPFNAMDFVNALLYSE